MASVFREKRIYIDDKDQDRIRDLHKIDIEHRTHDFGVPRARNYSLSCRIRFTEYSGYTIAKLIETNFNYFTWLPRNINDFTYDEKVMTYAKDCLDYLELIENFPDSKIYTKLGKTIPQVEAMVEYEQALDFGSDDFTLMSSKLQVDVKFYQTIINTREERLIRQSLNMFQNSSEYRRKYFEEINKDQ